MVDAVKVCLGVLHLVAIWHRNGLLPVNAEKCLLDATTNCDICPVLKHGPRSLTNVRVCGL